MDQSRRAVESYWRSRMVDGVTADDDKVAPVYRLEEICELLRASDASIVKEVADFILKRLDHKSPLVKHKVGASALPPSSSSLAGGFLCPSRLEDRPSLVESRLAIDVAMFYGSFTITAISSHKQTKPNSLIVCYILELSRNKSELRIE
jgi:hypothetical protein